jgi:hypothetical protein
MILLSDYSSQDRYFEFDPDTGAYSHIKLPARRKYRAGYSGVAQLLHSPGEGKVLVAQYLWAGDAWFSIGAERWRLFDESLVVKHTDTLFRCEFSIHQDGKCVRTFRYRRRDWFMVIIDPTYDYLDFDLAHLPLGFVPLEGYSLQKQRDDFIKMWSADSTLTPAASATIRLTRNGGGWDSRQRYQVMINGIEFGHIKSEEVFECKIPPGKVSLNLGVYWQCASNTLEFEADENSITDLECGSNLRGWKFFRAHKVTNDWIWLRFAASRIDDVTEGRRQR